MAKIGSAARLAAAFMFVCLALGLFSSPGLTRFYLINQDITLLKLLVLGGALAFWRLQPKATEIALSGKGVAMIAAATCAAAYAGHYWLLDGYALSRDEQMALFDAQIFANGRLAWPLPAEWQGNAHLLNTKFMPSVTNPAAWVSGYLPGNAMLRAVVGLALDPALTGAAMTGLAAGLTWLCARRLWPQEREPAVVALLLVALSGQVLMTGMTAYAMPAHLALNLAWLWLFLRGRLASDLAALALGMVATGLHQPIFHPLFVAPWLGLLLWRRQWGRLALFVLPYTAIGLFWLAWPQWQLAAMAGTTSMVAASDGGLGAKLAAMIANNGGGLATMGANLVRFIAWQPLALVPLCVLGWMAARRDQQAAALAGGIVLTLFAVFLLLPYQGHGFGYRYLHGLIGNAALLAAFGWRSLGEGLPQARTALLRSLALGAILTLPLQAWFGQRFYSAYAEVDRRITASRADFVLIGTQDAHFSTDLVFNRPDLSNRPLRLLADLAPSEARLAALVCRSGASVALPGEQFYAPIERLFGAAPNADAIRRADRNGKTLSASGCKVTRLD